MVKLLTLPLLLATILLTSSIRDVTSAAVDPFEGSSGGPLRPSDPRSHLLAPFRPSVDHARRRRLAGPSPKTAAGRDPLPASPSSRGRASRRYFRHLRPGLFF
nr:uncharacterized protein LOC113826996 [Penaeus vannamei]